MNAGRPGAAWVVSNSGMTQAAPRPPAPPSAAIEHRLTELEIKASYADDLLDTLNTLVARQQEQIDLLLREVSRLRQQGGQDAPAQPRNPRDELPPHY